MIVQIDFFLDLQEKSSKKEANKLGQLDRPIRFCAFCADEIVKT